LLVSVLAFYLLFLLLEAELGLDVEVVLSPYPLLGLGLEELVVIQLRPRRLGLVEHERAQLLIRVLDAF
jgi:hypothetical protein